MPVVENLSFSLYDASFLCIVGENGAGKTTLLKTLLGLIPPLKGNFQFRDDFKQTEIGYLPQHASIQSDFPASVKEIVLSGCLNQCGMKPFYPAELKQLALDNLDKLGIADLKTKSYRDLSGGQQQKVLLARALCASKTLLILDEPTASLDPGASREFYSLLKQLNEEEGVAIIMISHDVSSAIQQATEVLHLGNHSSQFFGTSEQYRANPLFSSTRAREGE